MGGDISCERVEFGKGSLAQGYPWLELNVKCDAQLLYCENNAQYSIPMERKVLEVQVSGAGSAPLSHRRSQSCHPCRYSHTHVTKSSTTSHGFPQLSSQSPATLQPLFGQVPIIAFGTWCSVLIPHFLWASE